LDEKECLILYKNDVLELWDVETGEYRKAEIEFKVFDFIV